MKIFHCDHCDQLVFFENFQCIKCGRALAYVPDLADIQSLEPAGNNLWKPAQKGVKSRNYRLCENYLRYCNKLWMKNFQAAATWRLIPSVN